MSVTTVSSKSKATSTGRASKRKSNKNIEPSEEDIRILAYRLYERRQADGLDGDAATDWVEAERTLRQE